MSVSGAAVEWKLTSWSEDSNRKWGYPAPKATGGQCSSSKKYCYPRLTASGSSRWGQLDQWVTNKLLKSSLYKWDRDGFNEDATTGLQTHKESEKLTWGDFIHKVLEKLSAVLVSSQAEAHKTLIWTREEWQSFEGRQQASMAPLDEVESGRRILFVIMCIITGLIEGRAGKDKIFQRRGRMCSTVDMALEFPRSSWEMWINPTSDRRKNRQTACSRTGGYDGCQEASIALILSIYFSLKQLCEECGPYRLTYWIKSDLDSEGPGGGQYCYFKDEQEICSEGSSKGDRAQVLITREGTLDVLDRPEVVEAAKRLADENEARGKEREVVVLLGPTSEECVDGDREERASQSDQEDMTQQLSTNLPQDSDEGGAQKNSILPSDSGTHILASERPRKEHEEKLKGLVSGGRLLNDSFTQVSGTTGKEVETPKGPSSVDSTEKGAKSETTEDFISRLLSHWPLIGGVVVVICLIVSSCYGLWRIFKGRRRPKRRVKPSRDRMKYEVGYR
ncbi:hypothetical protein C922_05485 [Plasmodium inui San Antonio 1]|uniref:Uncharacterized protein n=1 Tax=Plasmodium inui San Antonio 1 TaxID=1237626 RepID=W7AFR3_9APIC|nr:hypothetical protein C922_05485 [Plasmodium inui San Antonio 1]EUD64136.1 hypothetical protein C922_05485 [Plasmodium inui San Antonio 1]